MVFDHDLLLKHIRFVDVAKSHYPEINYPMILTIWKTRDDLVLASEYE